MALNALLNPGAIAVVGASQRRGRGSIIITNLREGGYRGAIYGVNPRYDEVLGCRCYPSVSELPDGVDCVVLAVGASAATAVLEEAHARGIGAAVVLASGFGEGTSDPARGRRLETLAAAGMAICGPNCLGFVNLHEHVFAYSGTIPRGLRPGSIALVSQSGGLGNDVVRALAVDRGLGFGYIVSCGNQAGVTIERYVDYFLRDPRIAVIGIVAEALKEPQQLIAAGERARAERKSIVLFQPGRTVAGAALARSHTGALAGNAEVLAAFLRRAGIVQVRDHDELTETLALFTVLPPDPAIGSEVVVVSGSGGAAAIAADVIAENGVALATLRTSTKARIAEVLPDFGSVTNPIDGTGAIYDDPNILAELYAALIDDPSRPVVATAIGARADGSAGNRRFAETMATASRAAGHPFVAYQNSPLGGPFDPEILQTLYGAHIPFLLGAAAALRALKHLATRRAFWTGTTGAGRAGNFSAAPASWTFLSARSALTAAGVPVVEAALARSEEEAAQLFTRFGGRVAVKAEVAGLVHKSDAGCVQLGVASADEARAAYRAVIENARRAGFATAQQALIQPMVTGVAEAFAGIIDDPAFGPAICFGLGGIFVEIFRDVTTEMAPLAHDDGLAMIHRIKAAALLAGARGRPAGDVAALAELLVRLGDFALAHRGRYRALDLNPIIVKAAGEGVVAVDVAVEAG